jgi:Family of unknown function (DUF6152)
MKRYLILLSALAVLCGPWAQALAHHGWAGQQSEQFQLSGKLHRDVNLAGPHGSMQLIDDNGQVWDITLAPPARVERAGLKAGVIPLGARITISGHRSSDRKRFEVKTERVTHDGRNFDVYPDRL